MQFECPYLNVLTSFFFFFFYMPVVPKSHLKNYKNGPKRASNLNCTGDVCEVMQHCRYAGNRDVLRLLSLHSCSEM